MTRSYGGTGDDRVSPLSMTETTFTGARTEDTVDYSAYTADVKVDLGNGLLQHGSVASTQSGNDAVFGFENFIGGSGNDTIVASSAANVMDGGGGNDTFVFGSAADANGDTSRASSLATRSTCQRSTPTQGRPATSPSCCLPATASPRPDR